MEIPDPLEKVPDYLKCPVCLDLPRNKVFQCRGGHILCEECHAQLVTCPQCRISLEGEPIRNLVVKQILDELSLECPWTEYGCRAEVGRKSRSSHVRFCEFNKSTSPSDSGAGSGGNINVRDDNGNTELHRAVAQMDLRLVQELISHGADVNIQNNKLRTALHIAGKRCSRTPEKDVYLEIIRLLIDMGTDVFPKDYHDLTFLHNLIGNFTFISPTIRYCALSPRQFHDLVGYLIGRGFKDIFNSKGWEDQGTSFQWAVQHIDVKEETLKLLKEAGTDFGAVSRYGQSVMAYAVMVRRNERLLNDLAKFGAV